MPFSCKRNQAPQFLPFSEEEINEEEDKNLLQLHFVGRRFKEFYALHDRLRRNKTTKTIYVEHKTSPAKNH